jgi:hypothetical protein
MAVALRTAGAPLGMQVALLEPTHRKGAVHQAGTHVVADQVVRRTAKETKALLHHVLDLQPRAETLSGTHGLIQFLYWVEASCQTPVCTLPDTTSSSLVCSSTDRPKASRDAGCVHLHAALPADKLHPGPHGDVLQLEQPVPLRLQRCPRRDLPHQIRSQHITYSSPSWSTLVTPL